MRISVIGAGGVGGYFGAKLAQAGHDVQFLARGRHLAALRERGLRIQGEGEDFTVPAANATDDASQLKVADVMLVTTKLWDLADTARQLVPAVGPATVVVPFQNGVDAVDLLAEGLPRERIAAGVAYISARIAEPGLVTRVGAMNRLRVGSLHPSHDAPLQALVAAGLAAGFGIEKVEDAPAMLWEKFVALNAMSAVTAVTRQTIGVVRDDPDLHATFIAAFREGCALAASSGVALAPDFEARHFQVVTTLPASMRASMAHDLLAGQRLEAPWLCGAVARRAAALGLEVPVNRTIWAALKPFAGGAPA